MTDTMPEQTEDWSDVEQSADATYPEMPSNPHNHVYTISMDGRGPMVVVRGNTPAEVNERFQALMDAGTTTIAASVYSHMKAEMGVAQGLGPVSPVAGPPAPPQGAPTPPPFGPNVSVPGAPGYAGPPAPPAPPAQQYGGQQQSGGGRDNLPEYRQAGWYACNVPFKAPPGQPSKAMFDQIAAQYQMKKGRPNEGGHYSFNSANKTWYVAMEYAGAFTAFTPTPA